MAGHEEILKKYLSVRKRTEKICASLAIEDYVVQASKDVSPPKWHLAHTTWFFEAMILKKYIKNYQIFNQYFHHLFNSYYQTLGQPFPKVQRGQLSRPLIEVVYQYRKYVDEQIIQLIPSASPKVLELIELGLHHEQQHQELLLMDIKYNYSLNPDFPAYANPINKSLSNHQNQEFFIPVKGGVTQIGSSSKDFCYDIEMPLHQVSISDFQIANRLVTNGEYLEFMQAKAYQNPQLWLEDGWQWVQDNQITTPLYWYLIDQQWFIFTLYGLKPLQLNEPVCHVSFYEANAYAHWRGKRLPTEFEWELFAKLQSKNLLQGHFLDFHALEPKAANLHSCDVQQLMGTAWEWTYSAFLPYPGYQKYDGELSEYNGKFMSNRLVLRGGCCWTPKDHIRISYRNFYLPENRWQLAGIRLVDSN